MTGDFHQDGGSQTAILRNDIPGGGTDDDEWGLISFLLANGFVELYLDGSPDPTPYEDLPEDFGIDSIDFLNSPPFITTSLTPITPDMPADLDGGTGVGGGVGKFYWYLLPLGLYEYEGYGGYTFKNIGPLADPYIGTTYPPVFTKWNGFLEQFLTNGSLTFSFQLADVVFDGTYQLYVNLNNFLNSGTGQPEPFGWVMHGTYGSYPPPPNPEISPVMSGFEFGGDATFQILTDASGIYTLTPGVYHDELYQRIGTEASTINVMIPNPFFKTGFIENK